METCSFLASEQLENPEDPPDFVIGADTVVVRDEVIMEKPLDPQDNLRMLADLNGNFVRSVIWSVDTEA